MKNALIVAAFALGVRAQVTSTSTTTITSCSAGSACGYTVTVLPAVTSTSTITLTTCSPGATCGVVSPASIGPETVTVNSTSIGTITTCHIGQPCSTEVPVVVYSTITETITTDCSGTLSTYLTTVVTPCSTIYPGASTTHTKGSHTGTGNGTAGATSTATTTGPAIYTGAASARDVPSLLEGLGFGIFAVLPAIIPRLL